MSDSQLREPLYTSYQQGRIDRQQLANQIEHPYQLAGCRSIDPLETVQRYQDRTVGVVQVEEQT